jgi:hypothetical protein
METPQRLPEGRATQLKWLEQYPDQTNPPDYWRLLFMESDDTIMLGMAKLETKSRIDPDRVPSHQLEVQLRDENE